MKPRFLLLLPLLLGLFAVAVPPASAQTPTAGVDYAEIPGGQPFAPFADGIEVVELFGYTCIHCANFESRLQQWKRGLPGDVRFKPVPVALAGFWVPYARAYYAAETLGVADRTHEDLFKALHREGSLPIQNASASEIASFYARHGVDPARFVAAMNSPEVAAKVEQANQFAVRSGIEGTPTLVINGKYRVMGRNFDDTLRIADYLIARERATRR